jgi:hypothetical protein
MQVNTMTTFGGDTGSSQTGGYFVKHDIAYYSGATKVVYNASPTVSYSYKVGYVMAINKCFTCFSVNLAYGTTTTLLSGGTLAS